MTRSCAPVEWSIGGPVSPADGEGEAAGPDVHAAKAIATMPRVSGRDVRMSRELLMCAQGRVADDTKRSSCQAADAPVPLRVPRRRRTVAATLLTLSAGCNPTCGGDVWVA